MNDAARAVPSAADRTPWFAFFVIMAVFFITQHNVLQTRYYLERGAVGFIATQEEAEQLMAGFEQGKARTAIAYVALGLFGAFLCFAMGKYRLEVQGLFGGLLILFVFWCFASLLWSEAPANTFKKLIILAMLCAATLGVTRRFSDREMLLFTLVAMGVYVGIGVMSEIALRTFRPWFAGYRFSGTCHPNGQALDCAFLMFAAWAYHTKRRYPALLGIALTAFVLLVLTKSRTSLAGAMLAPVLFSGLAAPLGRKIRWALFAGTACAAFLLLSDVVMPVVQQHASLGRTDTEAGQAKTLTGRTDLWNELASTYISQRPFLGYGYNSFWTAQRVEDISRALDFIPGNAHSIFVELWVGLGPIALVVYVLINLLAIRRTLIYYKITHDAAYAFYGSILIFSLVHGITESTFQFPGLTTFLSMVIWARLGLRPLAEPDTPGANETRTPQSIRAGQAQVKTGVVGPE